MPTSTKNWSQHRGRKIWSDRILAGEKLAKCSYRCPSCTCTSAYQAILPPDFSNGVDRLSIRVPLIEELIDPEVFFSQMRDPKLLATKGNYRSSTGVNIHCTLDAKNAALLLDFNPSRIIDPLGTSICPPEMAIDATKRVLLEITSLGGMIPVFAMSEDRQEYYVDDFEPGWELEVGVTRLDVARDFRLPAHLFNLDWLSNVKPKYAFATMLWRNKSKTETISGQFGKKTGAPKLYDKHLQSKKAKVSNPAPMGSYRFEQVMRYKHLKALHIHSLDQVNRHNVELALQKYWKKSKFNEPVIPTGGWLDYMLDDSAPTEIQSQAIAYFTTLEHGRRIAYTEDEVDAIKEYAASQGFNLRKSISSQSPIQYRLDFCTGHLYEIRNGTEQELFPVDSLTQQDVKIAA